MADNFALLGSVAIVVLQITLWHNELPTMERRANTGSNSRPKVCN